MIPTWNPDQYLKFAGTRTRAASDLLARVPLESPASVVDLGCGPGNSTALLAARWSQARITGVDSSVEMLTSARATMPDIAWVQADLATWAPGAPVDLIFANAVLHWLPEHGTLLSRLLGLLGPGGVLAVQMPVNFQSPAYRLLETLEGSREAVTGLRPPLDPEAYYRILAPHVCSVDIWETEYHQVMEGAEEILQWMQGTVLLPYLAGLDSGSATRLLDRIRVALPDLYPSQSDGRVLFAFRRLFFVAVR